MQSPSGIQSPLFTGSALDVNLSTRGDDDVYYQEYLMVLEVLDKDDAPPIQSEFLMGSVVDSEGQQQPTFDELTGTDPRAKRSAVEIESGNERYDLAAGINRKSKLPMTAFSSSTKERAPNANKTVDDLMSQVAITKSRRRERNKMLARKTRVKKKVELESFKAQIESLQAENSRLRNIIHEGGLDSKNVNHSSSVTVDSDLDFRDHFTEIETLVKDSKDASDSCIIQVNDGVKLGHQKRPYKPYRPNLSQFSAPNSRDISEDEYDDRDSMNGSNVINCVIVEDSVVQSSILARSLMDLRNPLRIIKIYVCPNGECAKNFLTEQGGKYADIWFIDQNLGSGDDKVIQGSDLIRLIREDSACDKAFVVGITADPATHWETMNNAGVDAVWGKEDMSVSTLAARVSRMLKSDP